MRCLSLLQPAEKRKSEGWEVIYSVGAVATLVILSVGLTYKPKNSIKVSLICRFNLSIFLLI
jgi:hypothetical protein